MLNAIFGCCGLNRTTQTNASGPPGGGNTQSQTQATGNTQTHSSAPPAETKDQDRKHLSTKGKSTFNKMLEDGEAVASTSNTSGGDNGGGLSKADGKKPVKKTDEGTESQSFPMTPITKKVANNASVEEDRSSVTFAKAPPAGQSRSTVGRQIIAAAQEGKLAEIKTLLQLPEVDVSVIDFALPNDATALALAAQNGYFEIVKLLVEAGANLNTVARIDDGRFTPLHMAANAGHFIIVQYLVETANVDPFGPLDLPPAAVTARKAGNDDIANYLETKKISSPSIQVAIQKKDSMVSSWDEYSAPVIGSGIEWKPLTLRPMEALDELEACFDGRKRDTGTDEQQGLLYQLALAQQIMNAEEGKDSQMNSQPGRSPEGLQSGVLTAMLQGLTEAQKKQPLAPKLAIAIKSSGTLREIDNDSDRRAVEQAIVAHWDSDLLFNSTRWDLKNEMNLSDEQHENFAARMVNTYVSNGLIRSGDQIMDVGTGRGLVPKLLEQQGFNVEAIEPSLNACGTQVFGGTVELTAAQYLEQNSGKKFDVVHVGNLHPVFDNEEPMEATRTFIRNISDLTADKGKALIGISSTDPFFVSSTSRFYLRPVLEACFEKVTFKSPSDLGETLSIGGQMGVYECMGPKRLPSTDQERS